MLKVVADVFTWKTQNGGLNEQSAGTEVDVGCRRTDRPNAGRCAPKLREDCRLGIIRKRAREVGRRADPDRSLCFSDRLLVSETGYVIRVFRPVAGQQVSDGQTTVTNHGYG